MSKYRTLYFITRADLNRGQASAQCIHGMNTWAKQHYLQGDHDHVVVYKVPNEQQLAMVLDGLTGGGFGKDTDVVTFHEPDYDGSLTVVVTDRGPLPLPLL